MGYIKTIARIYTLLKKTDIEKENASSLSAERYRAYKHIGSMMCVYFFCTSKTKGRQDEGYVYVQQKL